VLLVGASGAGAAPAMNQLFQMGSAAVTSVFANLGSFSLTDSDIAQDAGDGANQAADTALDAETNVDVEGDLTADNVIAAAQSANAAQSNQSITGDLDADLTLDLMLEAGALAAAAIDQEADGGTTNQQADAAAGANTEVETDLANTALNMLAAQQESNGDQANQEADIQVDATTDATTAILGTSQAAGTMAQQANGGPANQYITNVYHSNTYIDTLQQVLTMNILTILQLCNGQCNQTATILANAIANGTQIVIGDSSVQSDMSQSSNGDGPANQAIDAQNTAGTDVSAEQSVISINDVTVVQEGGDQSNQNADIAVSGNADGAQIVIGTSVIDAQVQQNANGDGPANQQAEMNNASDTDVSAEQAVVSVNDVGVSQSASGVQGTVAQSIEIDAESDATGLQAVVGTSFVVSGITQNADGDGMYNQNAAIDSESSALVGATQGVIAINDIAASQDATVTQGAGAQSMIITPSATADATQVVIGAAGNVSGIVQDADGDDAKQAASIDADASTDVQADQTAVALNIIDASQEQNINHGAGAQWVLIAPVAGVQAAQQIEGSSGNVSAIEQDADGDQSNQQAGIDVSADTEVAAEQEAIAVNTITLQQSATANKGAVAQAGEVAPVATTTATQTVSGSSGNLSGIEQEGGDGQGNQDASIEGDATTSVDAGQNAISYNDLHIVQACDVTQGACAQYFYIIPVATTDADQQVAASSGNGSYIGQSGGDDQSNQQAAVENAAETDVNTQQNAQSGNTTTVYQTCTVNMSVCAQYTEVDLNASTQAGQIIAADTTNDTVIEQSGGDQGNQNAEVNDSAVTTVDAVQNAESVNDTTIVQSGGSNGSQTANVTGDATTTSTVNISGSSGNTTTIIQD
jgi:hypothetical protein